MRAQLLLSSAMWLALVASAAPQAPATAGQHAGEYSRSDVEQGYRLFGSLCAGCHGSNGDAIVNANLRAGQFRRAKSDADLRAVIAKGIPGTPMPPHDRLTNAELVALVAFVRNMRDFDSRGVALGDKARGQALFDGKGACTACHRVNGKGSRKAPDLSAIASTRTAAAMERTLLDPTTNMLPMNRSIRAVTRDGKVITGRRLNEDSFTVQIMDEEKEQLMSLDKSTLREYEVVSGSHMPSYRGRLTAQELADVLAYLTSLKGL